MTFAETFPTAKRITADFRVPFARVLVHAPPKRGKTSLIATLLAEGYEVLICDFDGGDSVSSLVPFLESGDYELRSQRMRHWCEIGQTFTKIFDQPRDAASSNQVLVIDTLTKAVDAACQNVQDIRPGKGGVMDQDHWNTLKGCARQFTADLLSLPCHVVLMAWSKLDHNTERWVPDLVGSVSNQMTGAVGQILYLDLDAAGHRQLRSDDTHDWLGGDRSGRLDARCGTSLGAILRNVAERGPRVPSILDEEDATTTHREVN